MRVMITSVRCLGVTIGLLLFSFAMIIDGQLVPSPYPLWQAYIIGFAGLAIISFAYRTEANTSKKEGVRTQRGVQIDKVMDLEPYLNNAEIQHRRIVFVHCENNDNGCPLVVEFMYPNNTFYYCKEDGIAVNLDEKVAAAGVVCKQHGPMNRYVLLKDDNVCPICQDSTLAILYAGIN